MDFHTENWDGDGVSPSISLLEMETIATMYEKGKADGPKLPARASDATNSQHSSFQ